MSQELVFDGLIAGSQGPGSSLWSDARSLARRLLDECEPACEPAANGQDPPVGRSDDDTVAGGVVEDVSPGFLGGRNYSFLRKHYDQVADHGTPEQSFLNGRRLARQLGYDLLVMARLPPSAVAGFIGLGNPFALVPVRAGDRILDVGCGTGFDSFYAAHLVGPSGSVLGVDVSGSMVRRAARMALSSPGASVAFAQGYAEALPTAAASVDVVVANGALNHTNRSVALGEMFRVLRPGGRLQFCDVMQGRAAPIVATAASTRWTAAIHDRLTPAMWIEILTQVGFGDIEVGRRFHPWAPGSCQHGSSVMSLVARRH